MTSPYLQREFDRLWRTPRIIVRNHVHVPYVGEVSVKDIELGTARRFTIAPIYQPPPLRAAVRPWRIVTTLLVITLAGAVAMSYGIPAYFWIAKTVGDML